MTPNTQTQLSATKQALLDKLRRNKAQTPTEPQGIPRSADSGPAPLSFAEQRLWFLEQFEGGHPTYNEPLHAHLTGPLNVVALERAWQEIVRRHETLRSCFQNVDGQPVKVIAPQVDVTLPVEDLRHLPPEQQAAEVARRRQENAGRIFDLAVCPLFRAALLRVAEEEYWLLLTFHHIIYDGWSINILIHELQTLYDAFAKGRRSPLNDLPVQYRDFARWQRAYLQGEVLERQVEYWRAKLKGAAPTLDLPLDHPRPPQQTFTGQQYHFQLPKDLSEHLDTLSKQAKCTLSMTLLAAFKVLLYRYTGQEDVLVGSAVANRTRTELEPLIGMFVNTLVLRTDLSGNPTFLELLKRVRHTLLEAQDHQDLPFDVLLEELEPPRDLSHTPFFQVWFNFQNFEMQHFRLGAATFREIPTHTATAKFDLTMHILNADQGFQVFIEYNTALLEEATILRMAGHFQTLLNAIVASPNQSIREFPILTAAEQHQILVEWNNTAREYPQCCFHKLLEAQAERTPDKIAVTFEGQSMTYSELHQRANQLAHHLRQFGVGPEVLVGIHVERSLEMVIGLLGILKAGGAYVPLDPAFPHERLSFMVEDSRMPVLLTQEHLKTSLSNHQAQIICLDTGWSAIANYPVTPPATPTANDNLFYVLYTSGSTGKPKGVQITHRNFVNLLWTLKEQPGMRESDVLLAVTTLSFDIASLEMFLPLLTGARIVVVKKEDTYDGVRLFQHIRTAGITVMQATPVSWRMLVSSGWDMVHPIKVFTGGEALTEDLKAHLTARSPSIWNMYAPTETTVYSTIDHVRAEDPHITIGRPIANTQVYILDAHRKPVPVGVIGDLYLGGDGVARGYVNRDDLTRERFFPNPFIHGTNARVYMTGDLARYLPDGRIEFLGRSDHQIKIRGFRIELGEIETVLKKHPALCEAVVVARKEDPANVYLAAYLVLQPQQAVTVNDLREFLRQAVPDYMIPTTFMTLDALPLTPNGKVDRRALPVPDKAAVRMEDTYAAPRNPIEQLMVNIWQDVLNLDKVGIHDNFFALGGYSLLTMQAISRMNQQWQINITLQQFFATPTIAGLMQQFKFNALAPQITVPTVEPETLNLHREVVLDERIVPDAAPDWQTALQPAAVLLTGVTGFLGVFLLDELLTHTKADIYCLVRANGIEDGLRRIRESLTRYGIWHAYFAPRIKPVPGDLGQPCLGLADGQWAQLAEQIDVIYHNGALVNFAYPYDMLKAPNVGGTAEILRFAVECKTKPVQYISTTSVFETTPYLEKAMILEDDPLDTPDGMTLGYSQSKWVAEKVVALAQARGLPVAIYRPGRISGHSQTGAWNPTDFLCLFIKGCLQLGSVPTQYTQLVDLAPVDYVARAIVTLSGQASAYGQRFHIVNPQPIDWSAFVTWLCAAAPALRPLPYDVWQTELILRANTRENVLTPLLPMFMEPNLPREPEQFNCQHTLQGLAGTEVVCPLIDVGLLYTYWAYWLRSGFLSWPIHKQA